MNLKMISFKWMTLLCVMGVLISCGENANEEAAKSASADDNATALVEASNNAPEWASHLASIPLSHVPAAEPIQIHFNHNVMGNSLRNTPVDGVIAAEPRIPMTVVFSDENTIQITFDEPLIRESTYRMTLFPQKLAGIKDTFPAYQFTLQALKQDFSIQLNGLRLNDNTGQYIVSGEVSVQDTVDEKRLEKTVTVLHDGQEKSLQWQHTNNHRHTFSLPTIDRSKESSLVTVMWDGRVIDVDKKGEQSITIPALNDFSVVGVIAYQQSDQYIEVSFSDALDRDQSFKGLITLNEKSPKNTRVDGNRLLIYPAEKLTGDVELVLFTGIASTANVLSTQNKNTRLSQQYVKTLTFLSEFPGVRFVGNSHIIPKDGDMIVPIEAVNIDAVQITAYRTPKVNTAQFIQSATLQHDYNNQNTNVVLWRKTYVLPTIPKDKWQQYDVNVSALTSDANSDIFALSLAVDRSHSLLDCGERPEINDKLPSPQWPTNEQDDVPSWAEKYYQSQGYGAWEDRNNPCKSAFYQRNYHNTQAFRYFTASNLGLIAKMTVDHNVRVVVTDINTAQPLPGVTVTAYNRQNQELASIVSDENGFAQLTPVDVPHYILATHNDDVNFLRLLRNESLSTNVFDVGGEKTSSGIKGFFYGERDIWRPGDDIFLTFIAQNNAGNFPENYPLTIDFFDPKGNKKNSITNTTPVNGFYSFKLTTADDDLTGNWRAVIRYGGQYFDKKIPIETIVPNRLKIELAFPEEPLLVSNKTMAIDLFSQWLNGAPANGLKADVSVRASATTTNMSGFDSYIFDDPSRQLKSESQRIFEGRLDVKGKTTFNYAPTIQQAPGQLNLQFTTRVFEESGNFSTQYVTKKYQLYTQLVGVNIPEGRGWNNAIARNEKHNIALLSVDADGERLAKKALQLSLYRIEWRWWWDYSSESRQSYISDTHSNRIEEIELNTDDNGRANWELDGEKYEWGRYFLRACDNASGHCAGKVIYLGWSYNQSKNPSGDTQLMLTSDKKRYQVGDTAKITVPQLPTNNTATRLLLTVENGTQIISQQWLDKDMIANTLSIPITAEMAPNVYAHLTLLQAYKGKTNDRPVRLYGIIPLLVDNPNHALEPVIHTADKVKPQSTMNISVTEKQGKAMTYTLAVVDEGLLGVTNYQTPNPHHAFYQREALGVLTWDMYDLLAQSNARSLQGLITLGGSDKGKDKDQEKNKRRFPPVVKFLGPFILEANQRAEHSVALPEYMGAVRVMVVAANNLVRGEEAYGSTEKTVTVTQPLTLLATLPRVLGPNEQFSLPVSVFVSDKNIKEVVLSVTANTFFEYSTHIPTLMFDGVGDQIVTIPFTTVNAIGSGKVTVMASSVTADGQTESISQTIAIPIRPANNPQKVHTAKLIPAGETHTLELQPNGLLNTNSMFLELSRIPDMGLAGRLEYLIAYPHGCLEQTVSQLFPQLYVGSLTRLTDTQQQEAEKNIRLGIEKLYRFQQTEGMFNYWPNGTYSNTWANNYAGHFLLEARRLGYVVPNDMLTRWLSAQQTFAKTLEHRQGYESTHAYGFYTLALANQPDFNGMNRLREHLRNLRAQKNSKKPYKETASQRSARWLLAAAYARAGVKDAALEMMEVDSNQPLIYERSGYSYGSALRDTGILLLAYKELDDGEKMWEISLQIAQEFQTKDRWFSTQSTAWALLTMGVYFADNTGGDTANNVAQEHHFSYQINQGQWQRTSLLSPIFQQNISSVNDTEKVIVTIKNEGEHSLYGLLSNSGIPENTEETANQENVSIDVEYTDMDGKSIDVKRLIQGTDFIARVTVAGLKNNNAVLENLALTMTMPSGWQISHDRLEGKPLTEGIEYQQVLDDKVKSYFSLGRYYYYHHYNKRTITLETVLNASFNGKFYLPAWQVESMYNHTIKANNVGQWVEVVKSNE